jgi:hypothetical protein
VAPIETLKADPIIIVFLSGVPEFLAKRSSE